MQIEIKASPVDSSTVRLAFRDPADETGSWQDAQEVSEREIDDLCVARNIERDECGGFFAMVEVARIAKAPICLKTILLHGRISTSWHEGGEVSDEEIERRGL